MKITKRTSPSPKGEITVFRLENASGAFVELSTLGAGILRVAVPDADGRLDDVALGYADPADYLADGPCMGKVPGRYANRIAGGNLHVSGKDYKLTVNNGPNALHGGPEGFQNQIWKATELEDGVAFSYFSRDGEEHYPGNLIASAEYRWDDENRLTLRLTAVSDEPTVVNLTNHTYWNLDGADCGNALSQKMRINASRWLPTDETLIPDGSLLPVEGTPMNFLESRVVGERMGEDFAALRYGKGYDNCWAIDGWQPGCGLLDAVELHAAKSGRRLHVLTDQPGVQVYTGNWLSGSPLNREGRSYEDYDGIAIEAQGFPDAPNRPEFPSQTLLPGAPYRRTILFAFGLDR